MDRNPNIYTVDEEQSHRFYQLPKELFVNEKYRHLNSDAKLLYALLLDRKELSRKNNWVDEHNQVYLLYSRENLGEMMGISRPTVTKAFKQLIAVGLIIEERQGLTKPNKIYVCRLEYSSINGRKESFALEEKNLSTNDTEVIKTEKNKRYTIFENGGELLSYYAERFKEHFGKDHPTVTENQLTELQEQLAFTMMNNAYSKRDIMDMMDIHFEELSPKNDGKIFSFIGHSERINPMIRYSQDLDGGIDWDNL